MRVQIAETFTESVSRLEGSDGTAVKRAAFDYLTGPARPGHRLHRLVHAEDRRFWSLRVSRDLRIILHRDRDEVVLCYADHHDRAYAWAAHRFGAPGGSGVETTLDPAGAGPRRSAPAAPDSGPGSSPRTGDPEVAGMPAAEPSPLPPRPVSSRHDLRLVRRASAPLPAAAASTVRGAAPAPLVHLLRFFDERNAGPPRPGGGGAPGHGVAEPTDPDATSGRSGFARLAPAPGPSPWTVAAVILPWLLAGWLGLGAGAAAALALGQALCVGWLLRVRSRRAAREVEAARREAEARAAALAAALETLRRGEAPVVPQTLPAGELGRGWAVVEQLGRFFALEPGDIRALAGRAVGRVPADAP